MDYEAVCRSLENIPNDHALALGFNTELDPITEEPRAHPGYLFWRYLPVAPNNMSHLKSCGCFRDRPKQTVYQCRKANQALLDAQGADRFKARRAESVLFKACTQATSTQTAYGTPAMTMKFGGDSAVNSALQGVYDRIKPPGDKKNHIRRINQSKVTEHTLYSVITPNPALRLDEVGVPIGACIRMTVAERVTKENIEELRKAVIKGYPMKKEPCFSR